MYIITVVSGGNGAAVCVNCLLLMFGQQWARHVVEGNFLETFFGCLLLMAGYSTLCVSWMEVS